MMNRTSFLWLENGASAPLSTLPELSAETFHTEVVAAVRSGECHVHSFFALPENEKSFRLIAVLGHPASHRFALTSFRTVGRYPSLTPDAAAFHLFEREIAEQYGIVPEGHPWLKPVRYQRSRLAAEDDSRPEPGVTDFFRMKGDAVHEVAVGPIHAGVIEPGHFRFQCMGEDVYALEISLGYQHRGVEKLLEGEPGPRTLRRVETVAGDTSAAAALTYARLIEGLTGQEVDPALARFRLLALELERMANHIGDLGALAGDVAFLPTSSFCGRIRGEYLNMTAELCGNRFGRGLIAPCGSPFGLEKARADKLLHWMERVYPELDAALRLMFDSPTVLDRLENTGTLAASLAAELDLVGPAARACGLKRDARSDYPFPGYRRNWLPAVPVDAAGDVMSRARVRYEEIAASHEWLLDTLSQTLSDWNPAPSAMPVLPPDRIGVAVTEAWRGELAYTVVTDGKGAFRRFKIVDPSFHNWSGLAMALRGEQISNFPICNKSFNLSYCGHDL